MNSTSINSIRNLCKELGIHPAKAKGQNFLVDRQVLSDIIKAADLKKDEAALEIGPGLGVLTFELVKRAKKVVAVELDKKLADYLLKHLSTEALKHIKIINGDFISWFNGSMARLFDGRDYKVVANLPYQITSRVLRLLLGADHKPREIIVMVQKEVGDRICAKPGQMSVLSVMCQYYGEPEIVRVVSRNSFWPRPEVDSAILRIKIQDTRSKIQIITNNQDTITKQFPITNNQFPVHKLRECEKLFFKVVKIGFSSRRKMLKNNLGNVNDNGKVKQVLLELGLSEKVRAQELGVEEWMRLTRRLTTDDKG